MPRAVRCRSGLASSGGPFHVLLAVDPERLLDAHFRLAGDGGCGLLGILLGQQGEVTEDRLQQQFIAVGHGMLLLDPSYTGTTANAVPRRSAADGAWRRARTSCKWRHVVAADAAAGGAGRGAADFHVSTTGRETLESDNNCRFDAGGAYSGRRTCLA